MRHLLPFIPVLGIGSCVCVFRVWSTRLHFENAHGVSLPSSASKLVCEGDSLIRFINWEARSCFEIPADELDWFSRRFTGKNYFPIAQERVEYPFGGEQTACWSGRSPFLMDASATAYPQRKVWYCFEAKTKADDSTIVETFKSDNGQTVLVKISTGSH